jgi:NTE family protein
VRREGFLPFTLVLAGGGARGFAHVGVLRALRHMGLTPAGIVGVSMGSVVGAAYALREDWYEALLSIDTSDFPAPHYHEGSSRSRAFLQALEYVHTAWNMVTGWGAPDSAVEAGNELLATLLQGRSLEDGRIPVRVCATDLRSGQRIVMSEGAAASAVYASSALAGIIPPQVRGDLILADGVYSDVAPVDVARGLGAPVVVAVDPGQSSGTADIHNGLQAVMRATEICHVRHSTLRVQEADFVLRPAFPRVIDTLDFGARRVCVAAGIRAVRRQAEGLREILCERPGVTG